MIKKNVEIIKKFRTLLINEELLLLLLDEKGKIAKRLPRNQWNGVYNEYKKITMEDEQSLKKADEVSNGVVKVCLMMLKDVVPNNEEFQRLLKRYIEIEFLLNKNCNNYVAKATSGIDYKIARILKLLKINIDLNQIKNFRIEYNQDTVQLYVNNRKCLNLDIEDNKKMQDQQLMYKK